MAPEQSALWGFGRAAALELPQLWGGLVDADGSAEEWWKLIEQVAAPRLGGAGGPDGVAGAGGLRAATDPADRAAEPDALELRSDATYLVTGGLGSLGLEIAGYLAAHGARQLVLTSRRAPGSSASSASTHYAEQHGCAIRVITADVADPHDVARLMARRCTPNCRRWPASCTPPARSAPPRWAASNDAELDRVFAGKVWGAWHLSEAAPTSSWTSS